MSRSSFPTRLALWLAVCALLLKAAVPMLATASAQAQGKALFEVCTVYGVATVALGDDPAPTAPDHGATHAGDHCALSGVLALAAPAADAPALPALPGAAAPAQSASPAPHAHDACATWVARLKHGPPFLA
ncbi:MAG: hypothetical protein KF891_07010 [Rhizobacter sp.]|nr:hypothetical protein [Rhizobacter sp.]